jgi:hypothetical protein
MNDWKEIGAGQDLIYLSEILVENLITLSCYWQSSCLFLFFNLVPLKLLLALKAELGNELFFSDPFAVMVAEVLILD